MDGLTVRTCPVPLHTMKSCSYCGRENEEGTAQCRECGTELQPTVLPQSDAGSSIRAFLRQPAHIAWFAAAIVLFQAFIRLGLSPYDPSLGEGNVERVEAATWLWGSVGVSTVLVSLGLYLRTRRKEHHAASYEGSSGKS